MGQPCDEYDDRVGGRERLGHPQPQGLYILAQEEETGRAEGLHADVLLEHVVTLLAVVLVVRLQAEFTAVACHLAGLALVSPCHRGVAAEAEHRGGVVDF